MKERWEKLLNEKRSVDKAISTFLSQMIIVKKWPNCEDLYIVSYDEKEIKYHVFTFKGNQQFKITFEELFNENRN